MFAHISLCIFAATLGQAPSGTTDVWLKAVPGDVDVVVRSRGFDPTSRDLIDMIKAMSPRAAGAAVPAISRFLDPLRSQYGENAMKTPWVALARAVPPGPDGVIPFAVLVMKDDYQDVLKTLAAGKEVAPRAQEGGFDEIDNPRGGGPWYSFKGAGYVAVGPDKELIGAIAGPGGKSLDAVLTPALAEPFLTGDVGVFVNVERLAKRYADPIAQARQAFMAALDQAEQKNPDGPSMKGVKDMYGGLFDALEDAGSLALGLDFAAEGLKTAGRLDMKPGEAAVKEIAASRNDAAELDKLAAGAAFYMYMNMDASFVETMQNMSLRMLNPNRKPVPEMDLALKRFHELGRVETLGTASFENGMRAFNLIHADDPKEYIAASRAMLLAMKGADGPLNLYKDVKVEPDAQNDRGVSFTRVTAVFDAEKLEKLGAAGNGASSFKAMFGGDSMSYWIGVDGDCVIHITTPTWEQAKAQIDAFKNGESPVGKTPAFKAVRSGLADRASFMMIVDAQGFARMIAAQLSASLNKPELKDLAGLPREPAFFGLSLTPRAPNGYEFRFSLPSPVVPVFENGMVPLFRNLQRPVNQ